MSNRYKSFSPDAFGYEGCGFFDIFFIKPRERLIQYKAAVFG